MRIFNENNLCLVSSAAVSWTSPIIRFLYRNQPRKESSISLFPRSQHFKLYHLAIAYCVLSKYGHVQKTDWKHRFLLSRTFTWLQVSKVELWQKERWLVPLMVRRNLSVDLFTGFWMFLRCFEQDLCTVTLRRHAIYSLDPSFNQLWFHSCYSSPLSSVPSWRPSWGWQRRQLHFIF